jgi:hypothetical protein
MYRYKGRDEPLVYKEVRNSMNPRYDSLDFSPVGYTGAKLHRNEVCLIVQVTPSYRREEFILGSYEPIIMYSVKIMSPNALGWISAGELETVFEEVTEDDQETNNEEQETGT